MRAHTVLRTALTGRTATSLLSRSQRRFASSEQPSQSPAQPQKQPSNYSAFYKTFTRPLAKTMLLAIFTYQLVYWGWVKLETDEIKAGKNAEIAALEAQVKTLQEAQASNESVGS